MQLRPSDTVFHLLLQMECTQVLQTSDLEDSLVYKETVKVAHLKVNNQCYPIYSGSNVIGRDPDLCSVAFNNTTLSRKHAIIEVDGRYSHVIYDLDSKNKTRLEKMHLKPHVRYHLPNNSQVQFGDLLAEYCIVPHENEDKCRVIEESDDEIIPETPVQVRSKDTVSSSSRESPTIFDLEGDSSLLDVNEDVNSSKNSEIDTKVTDTEFSRVEMKNDSNHANETTNEMAHVSPVSVATNEEKADDVNENSAKTIINDASDGDETDPEDIFFSATQKCIDNTSEKINSANTVQVISSVTVENNEDSKETGNSETEEQGPTAVDTDRLELVSNTAGTSNEESQKIQGDVQEGMCEVKDINNSQESKCSVSINKDNANERNHDAVSSVSDETCNKVRSNDTDDVKNSENLEMSDSNDSIYTATTQVIVEKMGSCENSEDGKTIETVEGDRSSTVRDSDQNVGVVTELDSNATDKVLNIDDDMTDRCEEQECKTTCDGVVKSNIIFDPVNQVIPSNCKDSNVFKVPKVGEHSSIRKSALTTHIASTTLVHGCKKSSNGLSRNSPPLHVDEDDDSFFNAPTQIISGIENKEAVEHVGCDVSEQNCSTHFPEHEASESSHVKPSSGHAMNSESSKTTYEIDNSVLEKSSDGEPCDKYDRLSISPPCKDDLSESFFNAATQVVSVPKELGLQDQCHTPLSKSGDSVTEQPLRVGLPGSSHQSAKTICESDSSVLEKSAEEKSYDKLENTNNSPSLKDDLSESFFNAATQVVSVPKTLSLHDQCHTLSESGDLVTEQPLQVGLPGSSHQSTKTICESDSSVLEKSAKEKSYDKLEDNTINSPSLKDDLSESFFNAATQVVSVAKTLGLQEQCHSPQSERRDSVTQHPLQGGRADNSDEAAKTTCENDNSVLEVSAEGDPCDKLEDHLNSSSSHVDDMSDSFFIATTQIVSVPRTSGIQEQPHTTQSEKRDSITEPSLQGARAGNSHEAAKTTCESDNSVLEVSSDGEPQIKLDDNVCDSSALKEDSLNDSFFDLATQVLPVTKEFNVQEQCQTAPSKSSVSLTDSSKIGYTDDTKETSQIHLKCDNSSKTSSGKDLESVYNKEETYEDSFFSAATQVISDKEACEEDNYYKDGNVENSPLSRSSSYSSIHEAPTQCIDEIEGILSDQQNKPSDLKDSDKPGPSVDNKMEEKDGVILLCDVNEGPSNTKMKPLSGKSDKVELVLPSTEDLQVAGEELYGVSPNGKARTYASDSSSPVLQKRTRNVSVRRGNLITKYFETGKQTIQPTSNLLNSASTSSSTEVNPEQQLESPVPKKQARVSKKSLSKKNVKDTGSSSKVDCKSELQSNLESRGRVSKRSDKDTVTASKKNPEQQAQSSVSRTKSKVLKLSDANTRDSCPVDCEQKLQSTSTRRLRVSKKTENDKESSSEVSDNQQLQSFDVKRKGRISKRSEKELNMTSKESCVLHLQTSVTAEEAEVAKASREKAKVSLEIDPEQKLQSTVTRRKARVSKRTENDTKFSSEVDQKQLLQSSDVKRSGRISRRSDRNAKAASEENSKKLSRSSIIGEEVEVSKTSDYAKVSSKVDPEQSTVTRRQERVSRKTKEITESSSEVDHKPLLQSPDAKRSGRIPRRSDRDAKVACEGKPEPHLPSSVTRRERNSSKTSEKDTKVSFEIYSEQKLQSTVTRRQGRVSRKSVDDSKTSSEIDPDEQLQHSEIKIHVRSSRKSLKSNGSRVQSGTASEIDHRQDTPFSNVKKQKRILEKQPVSEECLDVTKSPSKTIEEEQLESHCVRGRASRSKKQSISRTPMKGRDASSSKQKVLSAKNTDKSIAEETVRVVSEDMKVTGRSEIAESHGVNETGRPSRLRKMTWKARESLEDSPSALNKGDKITLDEKCIGESQPERNTGLRRNRELADTAPSPNKKAKVLISSSSDTEGNKPKDCQMSNSPNSDTKLNSRKTRERNKREGNSVPSTPNKRRKTVVVSSSSDQDEVLEAVVKTRGRTPRKEVKMSLPEKENSVCSSPSFTSPRRRKDASQNSNTESDSQSSTPTRSQTSRKILYRVMFTGINCPEGNEIAIKKLGGKVVQQPNECTVLVTDKVRRTFKFLCIMGQGKPIVSLDWVAQSQSSGQFLDPWNFIVKDKEAEKKYKFQLQSSLKEASQHRLLDGYSVFVTSSVQPPPSQMRDIVESCGGHFLKQVPRNGVWPQQCFIISALEDKKMFSKFKKTSVPVVSVEILLTGVLQQKLNLRNYIL